MYKIIIDQQGNLGKFKICKNDIGNLKVENYLFVRDFIRKFGEMGWVF